MITSKCHLDSIHIELLGYSVPYMMSRMETFVTFMQRKHSYSFLILGDKEEKHTERKCGLDSFQCRQALGEYHALVNEMKMTDHIVQTWILTYKVNKSLDLQQ